jgi:ribosomal protein S18 acetylase RimI-like enzyme
MTGIQLIQATSQNDFLNAGSLFVEYAGTLAVDLCFQGFSAELERLPSMYGPPGGCLLLAHGTEGSVGCVGIRRLSAWDAELKRLYVRPHARSRGIGQALALAAIHRARHLGYHKMMLDTLSDMIAARRLYYALGFRECDPYYDSPIASAVYMQLDLRPA